MILVLLGTQDSPFPRILQEVEKAMKQLNIDEEIYAQTGTTNYQSERLIVKDYFLGEEYERLIHDARLIICHGGAGILYKCIHLGKKIIAMPRLAQLGEHNDNHQVELVHQLASFGYVLEVSGTMEEAMKEADSFIPKKYEAKNTIVPEIVTFIDGI
ncbi:MAG: hypothetical protein LBV67_09755 [Streptococcaceae bacterium]|jgi:UDP-N-acetylglucosamine transferase subunit ALG13|nr:hypothetical protein [Streptococcaceae bacterium]